MKIFFFLGDSSGSHANCECAFLGKHLDLPIFLSQLVLSMPILRKLRILIFKAESGSQFQTSLGDKGSERTAPGAAPAFCLCVLAFLFKLIK